MWFFFSSGNADYWYIYFISTVCMYAKNKYQVRSGLNTSKIYVKSIKYLLCVSLYLFYTMFRW